MDPISKAPGRSILKKSLSVKEPLVSRKRSITWSEDVMDIELLPKQKRFFPLSAGATSFQYTLGFEPLKQDTKTTSGISSLLSYTPPSKSTDTLSFIPATPLLSYIPSVQKEDHVSPVSSSPITMFNLSANTKDTDEPVPAALPEEQTESGDATINTFLTPELSSTDISLALGLSLGSPCTPLPHGDDTSESELVMDGDKTPCPDYEKYKTTSMSSVFELDLRTVSQPL